MNQILFGGALIDVDEIESTEQANRSGAKTRIYLKNGHNYTLRGEAKCAFDAWAEARRPKELRERVGSEKEEIE